MIRVVDYGLGNVQAFLTAYQRLGYRATRAQTSSDLMSATKVILPGVGAFDHALGLLETSGMMATLLDMAAEGGAAILGVCVGMQMLADSSEEGTRAGLGLIPGSVRSFSRHPASSAMRRPHMGWNDVRSVGSCPLFADVDEPCYYFLHSFYFDCLDASDCAAVSEYGFEFASSIQRGSIFGVQFHPEKSHHWGSRVLENFARL